MLYFSAEDLRVKTSYASFEQRTLPRLSSRQAPGLSDLHTKNQSSCCCSGSSLTISFFTCRFSHEKTFTIFPLSCCWINDAKKLIVGDCLGVKVCPDRTPLHYLVRLVQGSHHLRLARACVTHHENRVPDCQQLLQLHHLRKNTPKF